MAQLFSLGDSAHHNQKEKYYEFTTETDYGNSSKEVGREHGG